jgi:DNA-binding transcriptional LysR family regulator
MDIKLLRSFITLAGLGHFGRAADVLCVTQPTLSKQIANLEAELGARLFERGRHGAELTAFGALFLPDAQRLIQDADQVLLRAREASLGKRGRLRIGFGLSSLEYAPQAIAAFSQRYPDVAITLNDYSSAEQTQRILAGELELGFIRLPCDAALATLPLFEEQLALAVPAASKWQAVPDQLAELNALGFIALTATRGPGLAAQIQQWCNAQQFNPRITQYSEDIQTILAIVAAGLGVALLPYRAGLLLPQNVRLLPFNEPAAHWQVGLAWQAGREDPVVKGFVDLLAKP